MKTAEQLKTLSDDQQKQRALENLNKYFGTSFKRWYEYVSPL